jgi:O-acetyl-ADP-ribose deacetylase (regulator of RNase III)
MTTFHFVNTDKDCLAVYREVLSDYLPSTFTHCTILERADACCTFVSAANSRLCFDGGSDLDYIKLFGDPHDAMCTKADLYKKYFVNKHTSHLPVGAAMIHSFEKGDLIAAPTMILPQSVPNTQNAYWSFKMTLELLRKSDRTRNVLVPGLCTGIGNMSSYNSAHQILRAWKDLGDGMCDDVLKNEFDIAYSPIAMQFQPDFYCNSLYTVGAPSSADVVASLPSVGSRARIGSTIWW